MRRGQKAQTRRREKARWSDREYAALVSSVRAAGGQSGNGRDLGIPQRTLPPPLVS